MAVPQTPRSIIRTLPLLLLLFAVLLVWQSTTAVHDREGQSLWAVRDREAPPEGVRAFPGYSRQSLGIAFARSQQMNQPPLYYLLLDAWTLLAGQSLLAARLPSIWFALIMAAYASRVAGRRLGFRAGWLALALLVSSPLLIVYAVDAAPQASLIALLLAAGSLVVIYALWRFLPARMRSRYALVAGLVLLLSTALQLIALAIYPQHSRPDWPGAIAWMQAERQPTEPTVTLIDPASPLAYYVPQFQQGITLDLGWQPQTPTMLTRYTAALENAPVIWAVLPQADGASQMLLGRLQGDYAITDQQQAGEMIFYRLERGAS